MTLELLCQPSTLPTKALDQTQWPLMSEFPWKIRNSGTLPWLGLRWYTFAPNPPSSPTAEKSKPFLNCTAESDKATPLSPPLLDMALVPLAIGVGIEIGDVGSRVGFYADDTLLWWTDTVLSTPPTPPPPPPFTWPYWWLWHNSLVAQSFGGRASSCPERTV